MQSSEFDTLEIVTNGEVGSVDDAGRGVLVYKEPWSPDVPPALALCRGRRGGLAANPANRGERPTPAPLLRTRRGGMAHDAHCRAAVLASRVSLFHGDAVPAPLNGRRAAQGTLLSAGRVRAPYNAHAGLDAAPGERGRAPGGGGGVVC